MNGRIFFFWPPTSSISNVSRYSSLLAEVVVGFPQLQISEYHFEQPEQPSCGRPGDIPLVCSQRTRSGNSQVSENLASDVCVLIKNVRQLLEDVGILTEVSCIARTRGRNVVVEGRTVWCKAQEANDSFGESYVGLEGGPFAAGTHPRFAAIRSMGAVYLPAEPADAALLDKFLDEL